MLINFGNNLLVPILPLYAAGFDISYALIGLILAGEGLGTLLADVPTGMMQKRFGNKQVMMMGFVVATISTLSLFFVQSIWIVFILRLFAGFGKAMYGVSMHIYIANHVQLHQRGKAISIYGGVHRLGGFIGPAVGGIVAAAFGLRAPFLLFAVTGLIGLGFIALFTHNSKTKHKNDQEHEHS
ncbi:MAG: hypothetical protein CUN56_14985, partial [Phototrophicales bacterium]